MKAHIKNNKMTKFEAPGIKEWFYTTVWLFGKFRGFVWKMLRESNALLSDNFFYMYRYIILTFLKFSPS